MGVPVDLPAVIGVRGARHNNLRDIDVDVPLWRTVAVVGVSGSGKTSLAIGTLYAEGLHRFLEGLSTYSRRRLTQAQRPDVDRIDHLPPALALRQRPPIPGPRSTVGTMSEVLNVLRLMMSRLGSHLCPNGHRVRPSIANMGEEMVCPVCGARFQHPSAESFSFNSYGACPACQGLGVRSEVDDNTLVSDPSKTIAEGAVRPWNSGGRRLSMYAAGELGVRLDVPYGSLSEHERDIVLHGAPVERQVTLHGRNGRTVQLNVNYDNAVAAVERSLRSDNERTRRLVQRFVVTRVCSVCHGTRLRPEALTSRLDDRNLAEISALTLGELPEFTARLSRELPAELGRLTRGLLAELSGAFAPLLDIGLSYLTLDRAGASLSTGERQRIELTSTVRASTTGMLYVLDEPSVGLHPINVQGLRRTIAALANNGNSVVIVEHERDLIRSVDWVIEMGPGAGREGGTVIAEGTPGQLEADAHSIIGAFLAGARFNDATLAVRVDGLNCADVLGLSVDDALARFADRTPVASALRPVQEVGLGYLRLGEPTPSLSGGESQRLRIASRLRTSQHGTLYVFDEPSTGLHPLDVATLVAVFDRLIDAGATVIVIDHDLDLLAAADYLIDMGPGGGPDGGHILATGTPHDVARSPRSVTGPWLAEYLAIPQTRPAGASSRT